MKKNRIRFITVTALLSAVAVLLQYLEISVPIMPSFIKLDFSDLPALIGAYAYGPFAGIVISFLKNIIHIAVSQSVGIGELSNFILCGVFSFVTGLIYSRRKTKKSALISGCVGALVTGLISYPLNCFAVYPLYYSVLGFPEEAVLEMYRVIIPSMKNIGEAVLVFNVPFTIIKELICVVIAMLIYKPLSPLLKGKKSEQ